MNRTLLALAALLVATGLTAEAFDVNSQMPALNLMDKTAVSNEVEAARMRAERNMGAQQGMDAQTAQTAQTAQIVQTVQAAQLPPAPANLIKVEERVPMPTIAAPAMPATNGLQPIKPSYRPS